MAGVDFVCSISAVGLMESSWFLGRFWSGKDWV